ncbi:MAG: 3-octaprenyl-4-hydroxybenzoate decarboxylase, partial [Ferrovum sp.]|nr:3-octaprenyl-4-hydroxybenzoate decarboxylase [Ferrovum sp.]
MAYTDLRDFLRDLEQQKQLLRVTEDVDPHLESTALCQKSLSAGGPALLFTQPRHSRIPLLGNLFGTPQRI